MDLISQVGNLEPLELAAETAAMAEGATDGGLLPAEAATREGRSVNA